MDNRTLEKLHRINYLIAETDALYHQASLKLGISDSAMRVLYTVHDCGGSCQLSDIYKRSGISKQTVNSALRKLEADGVIYLSPRRAAASACGSRGPARTTFPARRRGSTRPSVRPSPPGPPGR